MRNFKGIVFEDFPHTYTQITFKNSVEDFSWAIPYSFFSLLTNTQLLLGLPALGWEISGYVGMGFVEGGTSVIYNAIESIL